MGEVVRQYTYHGRVYVLVSQGVEAEEVCGPCAFLRDDGEKPVCVGNRFLMFWCVYHGHWVELPQGD